MTGSRLVLTAAAGDVCRHSPRDSLASRGQAGFIYEAPSEAAFRGSERAAQALEKHPRVAYVERDARVSVAAQATPTGIDPSFARRASLGIGNSVANDVDVDVAVVDTGIDREHPDLDVVDGITCQVSGRWWRRTVACGGNGDDDHYHGTHVAGTIAAREKTLALSASLLERGSGPSTSWTPRGRDDCVVRQGDIEVVNMSLGGSGVSTAYDDAIKTANEAGLALAVAAGNLSADAGSFSPAFTAHALTVSALADFDGRAGGNGSPTCRNDLDDTLADFSNWGSAVDICPPGGLRSSTYPVPAFRS